MAVAIEPTRDELLQRVARLEAENAALRRQVDDLTRKLDEALRAGKRQAAPFRKGPPKAKPKAPGRKPDDGGKHAFRAIPKPEHVDQTLDALLPDACPHCHGPIRESEVADQYQTEIPRKPIIRRFRVHIGHCTDCGRRAQGRHPLQTSDALGAAASQIGPDAQAAAAVLHTQAGLSHGKVAYVFDALFGITLTRGASAQIDLRAARRLEPTYQDVLATVRDSEVIAGDETGWRVGGRPAWLHVWVGDRATAYGIDPQRSAAALERVIGVDWSGTLCHDGYSTYGRFAEAIHQQCIAHVLRRAEGLVEGARGGAVHFPRQVIRLFTEAVHLRNEYHRGAVPLARIEDQREVFDRRLVELLSRPRSIPEHARLVKHLWRYFEQWFSCLVNPAIEATNWMAEQAIRPAVVNRKVWGGNRTWAGARAQEVLMSVFETCRRQSRPVLEFVSGTLRSVGNLLLPRPTLDLGR
jgi:transposase